MEESTLKSVEKMVQKFAWDTLRKMPGNPMWEYEDLIQQGWEEVMKAHHTFRVRRPKSIFPTYVQNCLWHKSVNILRDVYRRPSVPSEVSSKLLGELSEGNIEGAVMAAFQKLRKGAKSTLEALLFKADKPTLKEVSKYTGKSLKTTHRHFQQIKEAING